VSPLRARAGLPGERPGRTEATVALCVAALTWGMPLIDIADLRTWL
jgi:3,4-dihydroxy-2-butanone 4-phosphate synthase